MSNIGRDYPKPPTWPLLPAAPIEPQSDEPRMGIRRPLHLRAVMEGASLDAQKKTGG